MKAVVAAFNQEKALVGAFSVIVQLHRLIDLQHYSLLSAGRRLFDLAKLSSTGKWVIKHFYSNSYDIAVAPGPRDQFFRKFKVGKVEAWCLNYSWEMLDAAGAQAGTLLTHFD